MHARRHVHGFRLGLIAAFVAASLSCDEGEDCGCLDEPPTPVADDDDTTGDVEVAPLPPELEELLAALPACDGGVVTAFDAAEVEPPGPGSGGYLPPSLDTLEAITASVESVRDGDTQLAFALVAVVGYQLCRGEGPEEGVVLWRPSAPGSGRALFAWRLHAARPLQVGVPHPWEHPDTLSEGRRVFTELRARTLVAAGASRCASDEVSGCAGDDACGPSPVRSDMAYSRDTLYQVAHEVFSDAFTGDLVVALEGRDAAGVVVSEGVYAAPSAGSPAVRVLDALITDGEQGIGCASPSSTPTDCGVDNVQGLYVNGSAAACGPASPGAVAGRFLHLAQSADVAGDGDAVLAALAGILPQAP